MPKRSLAECEEPSKVNKEQPYHPLPKELENYKNLMPMTDNGFWEPIASEEPTPPKRKRSAGGCNQRKSLAWNPAFFTEEGVLDPDELSVLTGPLSECDENLLHTTHGEKTLLSPGSYNDGCNLKELDENFFKELGPGSIREDNKVNGRVGILVCSPQQGHCHLKGSLAVYSTKNPKHLVSRHGGCPKPPASYSTQKMVSKINTSNAICKLPKFEVAKVNTFISAGPGNATLRSIQSTPTVKSEAKIATKSTSKSTTDKFACSTSSFRSFSNSATSSIRSFSNRSKDNLISLLKQKGSTNIGMSNVGSKTNLEQNMQDVAHAKPSRMRMPSPSLGFFTQAKSSIQRSFNSQKDNERLNPPESRYPISKKHNLRHSRMSAPPEFRTSAAISASSAAISTSSAAISASSAAISASSAAISTMSYNSVSSSKFSVPLEVTTASVSTLCSDLEPRKLTNVELKCQSDSSSLCDKKSIQVCISSEKQASVLHAHSLPCESVLSCKNGMNNALSVEPLELDCQPQKLLKVQERKGLSDSISSSSQRAGKIFCLSNKMDLTPNPDSLAHLSSSLNIETELTSNLSSKETNISNPVFRTEDGVAQDGSKKITSPLREKDATMQHVEEKLIGAPRPELACIKLNAAPFSDEWLAAIEAAGEDVLRMKTGAVQNSPPDKTLPEPSPWSPVKRNLNAGPFDCTKYTVPPTTTDL